MVDLSKFTFNKKILSGVVTNQPSLIIAKLSPYINELY